VDAPIIATPSGEKKGTRSFVIDEIPFDFLYFDQRLDIIPEMPASKSFHISYNSDMDLTTDQKNLLSQDLQSKIFLMGPGGSGKTTAGTQWLKKLIQAGAPPYQILVFVPQRTLAAPYQEILADGSINASGLINVVTLGGLARRMVDTFWPLVNQKVGFGERNQPPNFLTLETAQYYMAHLVRPLIEEKGLFESLTINRNRIYAQILDNLNKAAIVGFSHEEIGERLKSAWVGDIEQLHIYDDVQLCANQFRSFCLDNNLLDFSLQVEVFLNYLWRSSLVRNHLIQSYRYLIVDNIEEDTPVSHDILKSWLPEFDSALIIFDENAGFRSFLGADVKSALSVQENCDTNLKFKENLISEKPIIEIANGFENATARLEGRREPNPEPPFEMVRSALVAPQSNPKYFPEMISWVADQISRLLEEGVLPGEIVVLAPFMPDVLRFALSNRLDEMNIPNKSHRPSRPLRDEPATQTMLTLARVAYYSWNLLPERINLAFALMQVIDGLDLVRAQLLTAYSYKKSEGDFPLLPFEDIPANTRDRITYSAGEKYDRLRNWLARVENQDSLPLDFFLNKLFGEVLSQPGYGFHNDLDGGNTAATLIESIQKFRWAIGEGFFDDETNLGKEYIQMVDEGVIAAQYIQSWDADIKDAVLLSPAYTFLMSNRPVDVQIWLDIGSPSWYQRLDQPLTHPYVLSRSWEPGELWDSEDELAASYQSLKRLILGLLNRCRKKVYLGMSELDVRGYENRGLLIRIIQNVLQHAQRRGA
jgi:hypothetical protein